MRVPVEMDKPARLNERRLFSRLPCDAVVVIRLGETCETGTLIDVSLNGASLQSPQARTIKVGEVHQIEISQVPTQTTIRVEAEIRFVANDRFGCRFLDVAPDSIESLRELILTLGTHERLP